MQVSLEQFRAMIPTNQEPQEWFEIAQDFFPRYEIDTRNRIAGFMAQCAHESLDFTVLEENLNYSWVALRRTFARYFPTDDIAKMYERRPQDIANIVYNDANRINKLGNTRIGDGWLFRGRGIKQVTGKWNYEAFGKTVNMTAEQAVDYLTTKKGAFESACWFWKTSNLARAADVDDILLMTRIVNGGTIGLEDRRIRYENAKKILSSKTTDIKPNVGAINNTQTIQIGSRGDVVRNVQRSLGLTADGIFGPMTDSAVKSWQRINRFDPNGILTEQQFQKILGR
jgi:putative chitinase